MLRRYEHPITREIGEKAREVGGHGGMDFIMDYRLVYCLRHGLPLDQDVYDAAEWSSLAELTEASVRNGSMPVAMPDFTRGAWRKVEASRTRWPSDAGRPEQAPPLPQIVATGAERFEGQDYLSACNTRGISSERVFSV